MLFYTRQLFGACNQLLYKGRSAKQHLNSSTFNLDTYTDKDYPNNFVNNRSHSIDQQQQQTSSNNLSAYTLSNRQSSTDMLGNDRYKDEVIAVVKEDGRIQQERLNSKSNKLAGVVVNEKGHSHLLNARNRSSSLYNGNTINNKPNNLECPVEPELQNASTLNQRRNTSCSINMVNDNHKNNKLKNNNINDQFKQSNLLNDNQASKDQLIDQLDLNDQQSESSGLLNSVWTYLSNIPKKRSPSKTRNTLYNKLCNSLNSSPIHRASNKNNLKQQQSNLYQNDNQLKDEKDKLDQLDRDANQIRKKCTCKCTCGFEKTNQSAKLEKNDGDLESKIQELESLNGFPFLPNPPGKSLEKIGTEDWLRIGKEMVDYIAYYLETLDKRRVTPGM